MPVDIHRTVTSESVCEGQADKLADQVADAILDAILTKDPLARVDCAAAVTTGLVNVFGEITTDCYVDLPRVVRQTVREVGYNRAKYGFDAETCGVLVSIDEQSPDIAQAVDVGGAGDSGVMYGYACDDTPEYMPLAIASAHRLARRLGEMRRSRALPYLRPDGKVQVTAGYDASGRALGIREVVISAQHNEEVGLDQLRSDIAERLVLETVAAEQRLPGFSVLVNPGGRFVTGGPAVDAGITGRMTAVDTYGGSARHGGGTFSGKDPTKVERAGAYGARHVARTVVAAGLARRCEVSITYAMGRVKPLAVEVETFGTARAADAELGRAVDRLFDLSPMGIIRELNLRRPVFRQTAVHGHFGRAEGVLPWETDSRVEQLRSQFQSEIGA